MVNKAIKGRQRNPLHDHPLMRKGAVHVKSNKQKRRGEKQLWKKADRDLNASL